VIELSAEIATFFISHSLGLFSALLNKPEELGPQEVHKPKVGHTIWNRVGAFVLVGGTSA